MGKQRPVPPHLDKLSIVPPLPTDKATQFLSNLTLRCDEFITGGINIDKALIKRKENVEQLTRIATSAIEKEGKRNNKKISLIRNIRKYSFCVKLTNQMLNFLMFQNNLI